MELNDRRAAQPQTVGSRVEIVSIPWHFLASKYDLLDQLFLPLLSSAQRANDLMGVRARGDSSALDAATYLGGELLHDLSFAPVRPWNKGASNLYLLDFVSDTFQVESSVFSEQAGKEALFRVTIKGHIRGDKFQVLDSATGTVLFAFTRFEAEKQDFFTREFPFLAYESRKDPTLFGEGQGALQETINLTLGIPVSRTVLTVLVEKVAGSLSADVKSPSGNVNIMTVSLASLNNISKLVKTVGDYLAANPDVRQLLENDSVAPLPDQTRAENGQANKVEAGKP